MAEHPSLAVHGGAGLAAGLMLRKLLALKNIRYGLCAPVLDGGPPEGQVWLQWGRRVFAGPVLAAIAIEALQPAPTLFPNGNKGMPLALLLWSGQAASRAGQDGAARAAHGALIARQLDDGRAFLQGPAPGLADVAAWALLAASGNGDGLEPPLGGWYERVAALGLGAAGPCTSAACAAFPADKAADSLDLGPLAHGETIDDPALGPVRLEKPRL